MRITVNGSVAHAEKLVENFHRLKELGHQPLMHDEMFRIADGTAQELTEGIETDHSQIKRQHNFIRWWHDCIVSGDAILVCNYDKNGIKNYIGGNTFLEIGFAHVNNKKIFLLNPIPEEVPYVDEIKAMVDVVLDGDLRKIQ